MNYFAHALPFLDRSPEFVAGTAVPDWLSASDRKCRVRQRHVEPFVNDSPAGQLAGGIQQHLADDAWFHCTTAFHECTAQLTREFRFLLGPEDRYRAGLLGHIGVEIIIDAVLIERNPDALECYFEMLQEVAADWVEANVNGIANRSTSRLASFIHVFRSAQFLRGYDTPQHIVRRLNGVLMRVGLEAIPDESAALIERARVGVEDRLVDLLQQTEPAGQIV